MGDLLGIDLLLDRYGLVKPDLGQYLYKEIQGATAIWGAGEHTSKIIGTFPHVKSLATCVVDKNIAIQGSEIFGIPVISPEQLSEYSVNNILISSHKYQNEIHQELLLRQVPHKIVALYKEYEKVPFYDEWKVFVDLYYLKETYQESNIVEIKEAFLKQLIIHYLSIKDFYHSLYFLDEYVKFGYRDSEEMLCFKIELLHLLANMKDKLGKSRDKDLLFVLIDSLRFKDMEDGTSLEFLHSMQKSGISLTNSYSPSTYTRTSLNAMFTGRQVIDDYLYKEKKIDSSKSSLFQWFRQNNYRCINYGDSVLFDEDGLQLIHNRYTEKNGIRSISSMLWDLLMDSMGENRPIFSLIHSLEVHLPYICGFHSEYRDLRTSSRDFYVHPEKFQEMHEQLLKQRRECLRYVDKQLQFFIDFLSPESIKVITSDHGESLGECNVFGHLFGWQEDITHVPLVIFGGGLSAEIIDALFSMKNLGDYIVKLIEGETQLREEEFVITQRDPIYSTRIKVDHEFLECIEEKYISGFKAIRTLQDICVVYENGILEFYRATDESTNLLDGSTTYISSEIIKKIAKYELMGYLKFNQEGAS